MQQPVVDVEKVLQFKFYDVDKLPVAVIDGFYTEDELELIWHELLFINSPEKLKNPEQTGTARDPDSGEEKKKNKGIFLDNIYSDRNISDILTLNRKIFSEEVTNTLIDYHKFFKYVMSSNGDTTLVSYYEDSDYYKSHADAALVTAITWFYQEPKKFVGGDLILEKDTKIDCINNRCIFFPSILNHEVDEISMEDLYKDKGLGRYAVSQFLSIHSF